MNDQCLAATKSGAQCRKKAHPDGLYCATHANALRNDSEPQSVTERERVRWAKVKAMLPLRARRVPFTPSDEWAKRTVRRVPRHTAAELRARKTSTRRQRAAADRAAKLSA